MKQIGKLKHTLVAYLKQGLSPHELALTIALGVIVGMFPVQGASTLLCLLIAFLLRLNPVVIQLANYASIPLMLLTIVPFYTIGNQLFSPIDNNWNTEEIICLFRSGYVSALQTFSGYIFYAVLTWLFFAPVGTAILYFLALAGLRGIKHDLRISQKLHNNINMR